MSNLLTQVREGFSRLDVDDEARQRALDALERWLTEEPFAEYRPQLESLIQRGCMDALLDAFWQVIPFGTGGRRGPVGMGPNRFNPWTLGTSVQGHAEILRNTYPDQDVCVVIAFDVRVYRDLRGVYDPDLPNPLLGLTSADLAALAAGVYAANGVRVSMLDPRGGAYMSTPELSLAIRRLGAQGGLNVSASHNHPDDNGGKVYNRSGGQDVPPDDERLAQRVERIGTVASVDFDDAVASGQVVLLDADETNRHYLNVNKRLSLCDEARSGKIVFTPLHGTGTFTVGRVLREVGFELRSVPAQESLDGTFPGVKFLAPNPEVPTCFAEAEKVGDEWGADLLLATDPDADRIGLEVRDPRGGWRFVSGNEILFLVTRFVLDRRRQRNQLPPDAFLLKTLVTSSLVGTIAKSYGCAVVPDLLVGFKYMAEVLACLERDGRWGDLTARPEGFMLGAEESHGLLLTPAIRDKDAAGAALALAELNAVLVDDGRTLFDELEAIYARFGYVANRLYNTVMRGSAGLSRIRAIQKSLRTDPPTRVTDMAVTNFTDLADEQGRLGPIRSGTDAAARNVLVFEFENDARVIIRPSGTEPKIKLYVEVPGKTPRSDLECGELHAEQTRCDAVADDLGRAFERLMLSRVGVALAPCAQQLSPLLGLDHKLHFTDAFLPALVDRARRGEQLSSFVDESLAPYGTDPRELVAPGVAAYLAEAGLEPSAESAIRELFGLASQSLLG